MFTQINRSEPIKSCKLSFEDIKKLYLKLKDSVYETGKVAVSNIVQLETTSDKDFEKFKEEVLATYVITIVIRGDKGEALVETSEAVFSSPNLPNKVTSIYFDSCAEYKNKYNLIPDQWFTLTLDFNSPRLVDWENTLSAPTPNESAVVIQGTDETWVVGLLHKIQETINSRTTSRNFLHKSFSYDVGLWFIAAPLAFYYTSKASKLINGQFPNSKFLIFACHFYVFLMVLFIYRFIYGYTKWTFPKVELEDGIGLAKKHRAFWWIIISGLAIAILKDQLKVVIYDTFNFKK